MRALPVIVIWTLAIFAVGLALLGIAIGVGKWLAWRNRFAGR